MTSLDVAIIGGGPAGLTAAATLARQVHTVVVFDSNVYRNEGSYHVHTVPGWDHKDPKEFRATSRKQIEENYETVQFADVGVTTVEKKSESCFHVIDDTGKMWEVKKLILATGSSDALPELKGYGELWKKKMSVRALPVPPSLQYADQYSSYHCLFCLGYEDRGAASSGVLAIQVLAMMPALAVHMADNAAQLSKEVTIFTNGSEELAGQIRGMCPNSPFKVDTRAIDNLTDAEGGVKVAFADGSSKEVSFLVHSPLTTPQGPFAKQLGLSLSQTGDIQAEAPAFQTTERGVFAAGDCISPYKVIPHAIMTGNFAAVAAATQLQAEKYGHFSLV
jgi:thioredoxin reductase